MNNWTRIGQAAAAGVAGSFIGYLYGSLFGYVADRVFSDEPYALSFSFVLSVFAGMGWAAGLIIGWITALALWKDVDQSEARVPMSW